MKKTMFVAYFLMISQFSCSSIEHKDDKTTEQNNLIKARNINKTKFKLAAGETYFGEHNFIASGQPSQQRLQELVNDGYTIVSLRTPEKVDYNEEAYVARLGGKFMSFPTEGSDYLDSTFRAKSVQLLSDLNAGDSKVFLHCGSGNRVGAAYSLYLFYQKNMPIDAAITKGKQAKLKSLEKIVREATMEELSKNK